MTVLYSGRSPCCSGVDQIVMTLPSNVPLGCWVPVTVNAGGVVSNTATLAIAAACSDPANPLLGLSGRREFFPRVFYASDDSGSNVVFHF